MKKRLREVLWEVLYEHAEWLKTRFLTEVKGERANLSGADLRGADLCWANLRGADLYRADLSGADLRGANLRGADLYRADLSGADLRGADLRGANFRLADLRGADLYRADLRLADLVGADLSGADLSGADLSGADLCWANLSGANLREATGVHLVCPETGSFVGWKKGRDGELIKLLIPEDAFRSSATTRKCRCSKAIVLDIRDELGYWANINQARSEHDYDFVYKKGEMVSVPNFDFDRWKECAAGIHFFITAREAMEY